MKVEEVEAELPITSCLSASEADTPEPPEVHVKEEENLTIVKGEVWCPLCYQNSAHPLAIQDHGKVMWPSFGHSKADVSTVLTTQIAKKKIEMIQIVHTKVVVKISFSPFQICSYEVLPIGCMDCVNRSVICYLTTNGNLCYCYEMSLIVPQQGVKIITQDYYCTVVEASVISLFPSWLEDKSY